MFEIVEGCPKIDWYLVSCATGPTANTVYNGSIVKHNVDGVLAMGAATAGPNTAALPFGIVIGNNNASPLYSSTYQTEYITSAITQATALARDSRFQEGMFAKGDPAAMCKVALIDSTTVLRGPIRNAALATAPTVVTCTTASTDGLSSMVHGNADVALLANNNMYYARSGANKGLYRPSYAASQTTPTFYNPWPYDWSVGDTFCAINVGLGRQKMDFDATCSWIENSAALSNYFTVDVLSIDLSTAGQETVTFRFVL